MSGTLVVRDCTVEYDGVAVVYGLNFAVGSGECLGIIGPNGAGKTSLLKAIVGLVAHGGQVLIAGRDVTGLPPEDRVRFGVALVPEGRGLLGSLTVAENLRLGLYPLPPGERAAREGEMLEYVFGLFPRLRERYRQPARTLSGGEQQMLAVGRALMSRPRLLLLDEPTFGLAPHLVQSLIGALATLKAQGLTMVIVEQKLPLVSALCDRVMVMAGGKVVLAGRPEDFAATQLEQAYLSGVQGGRDASGGPDGKSRQ